MATLPFDIKELTSEEAQFIIPLSEIDMNVSIDEVQIVGQPRAMRALKMALAIDSDGYNIFVSGEPGTGKRTAIELATREWENDMSNVRDIAFIHNFHNPDAPIPLIFMPGKARSFSLQMKSFVSSLYNELILLIKEGNFDPSTLLTIIETLTKGIDRDDEKIEQFLTHIKEDFIEHQYLFKNENFSTKDLQSFLRRYTVNVLVDHGATTKRPLIFEYHPTFSNLFGSLDGSKESGGEHYLPFLSLHAGSLLQANGGYIVISAHEMLSVEGLYEALKRFLNTKTVVIQNSSTNNQSAGVRPLPIELKVKVIIVGSSDAFEKFSDHDEEFLKLFKVSAEFDYSMNYNKDNIDGTVAYLLRVAHTEGMLNLHQDAICEILRYSTLIAENREELTTQLALLADLLREAHYWAKEAKESSITAVSVTRAIEEREYIGSVSESRIQQEITSGEMIITLKGYKTGVVNGLAILDIGNVSFGTPTVISATVAPGSEGIVNIEHEAGLSGEIHDKGLLILEGYLRKRYARNFPLSIYSGICFEQSYGEIDGDSASSSELYALLSAIGEIPIKQNIAVTGSVNQMGELQPVGGINEKITGFYRVCKAMGNVAHPGVIIPYMNKKNLILPSQIIKAIQDKEFHIYPVHTIDEGMSVLSERPSGVRNQKGVFPVDTLNRAIEERLKLLYDISRPQN
ncbi:MAG: ATP-dependent protease [Spirochaetia bacterium]|nr:ATP-dependent protease [Spirochaetia bacterium]